MNLTDNDFIRLKNFMYDNFGINLEQKRTLVEGRLNVTIGAKGFSSFEEYINYMMADTSGKEVSNLVSLLTTNFTYFMREREHFDFMTSVALPKFVPKIKDKNLSVWSAGCSSGEEPYTIAMLIDAYFSKGKGGMDTKLLATDISKNVLSKAVQGVYKKDHINKIPEEWVKKYFEEYRGAYKVKQNIRDEIIFREFNLMQKTFSFKRKFHIIFCRNVMIYFDSKTRSELAWRFHNCLVPGGYMFVGMSETLTNCDAPFEYVQPSIYMRKE